MEAESSDRKKETMSFNDIQEEEWKQQEEKRSPEDVEKDEKQEKWCKGFKEVSKSKGINLEDPKCYDQIIIPFSAVETVATTKDGVTTYEEIPTYKVKTYAELQKERNVEGRGHNKKRNLTEQDVLHDIYSLAVVNESVYVRLPGNMLTNAVRIAVKDDLDYVPSERTLDSDLPDYEKSREHDRAVSDWVVDRINSKRAESKQANVSQKRKGKAK